MKSINTILFAIIFLVGGVAMAQQEGKKPLFKKDGKLIKATYYYEDGNVRQEGTYKNGKLEGEWISYDKEGEKTAIAQYSHGKKVGKWFFWVGNKLSEVDYENNKIAEVNQWKTSKSVVSKD